MARWQDEFLRDGDVDMPTDTDWCQGRCGLWHAMNPACGIDKVWLDRRNFAELQWILRHHVWTDCQEYARTRIALLVLEESLEK